ncbi:MAG: acetyl-CoA C-acyltransferase [Candidatus Hodarchaeota archaeon]
MVELNEVWLVDYKRTAFSRSRPGKEERDVFGEHRADELMGKLLLNMFDDNDKGITREDIDSAIFGCAMGVGENWSYGGRLPLWLAKFPHTTPSYMIDRQCGSSGTALSNGAMEIMTGYSKVVLCGGHEHLTRVPMDPTRSMALIRPNPHLLDKESEWYRAKEYEVQTSMMMIQTAQKLYEDEVPNFTKEDMDKFGLRSHDLTIKAQEDGWFKGEIVPVEGHVEGNVEEKIIIDRDMAARKSSLEKIAALNPVSRPLFLKKNGGRKGYKEREGSRMGVITAGNSSPLNAGASAAILMDAKEAQKRGIEPIARIVSLGWAAVDPSVMGRGPVPASQKALDRAGLKVEDIGVWEINEAFCIVALNCIKSLSIPEEDVNIHGGATAIGHPLGATMVRLPGTCARIMREKKVKYGLANACVGGGQGVAVLLENLDA